MAKLGKHITLDPVAKVGDKIQITNAGQVSLVGQFAQVVRVHNWGGVCVDLGNGETVTLADSDYVKVHVCPVCSKEFSSVERHGAWSNPLCSCGFPVWPYGVPDWYA